MSSRFKLAVLIAGTVLLAAGVYLIGNHNVALFDRDEPRYAECSREMLKGSPEHPGPNYIVPRFLGELRTAKPPGIYWLQVAAMKRLGDTAFAARLPSVIAMVLTLIVFSSATWKLVGPRRAAWATFIFATSMMVILSAKWCLTDAVLLLFVTTAQLCLYATYRGRGGWGVTILWCVCIGLAGLVKGPVVLAVQGMTLVMLAILHTFTTRSRATVVATVDVEQRFLSSAGKTILGTLIVAGIVGPWLWAIHRDAPGFLDTIIGNDVLKRMKTGLEGHSAPPGYHLVTIWATYFPWSIFLPMMLVSAFKRRHLPIIRFALATAVGNFIFFECVKTKLPHYLLPIYPWLALMTADAIVRCLRGLQSDLTSTLTRNALTVWGAIVILLGGVPWIFARWFQIPVGPTIIWTAAMLVIGAAIIYTFRTRRPRAGLICLGLGSLTMIGVLWGVYLPKANFLRTSILVGEELKRLNTTDDPKFVQMLDYKEPSLAFYQGGTIRENSNTVLTQHLLENPATPAYLVISSDVWKKSDPSVQAKYEVLGEYPTLAYADSMRGFNVMIIKRK
ncbi:glycosyltransferase family 39 protein [soil metagenome]